MENRENKKRPRFRGNAARPRRLEGFRFSWKTTSDSFPQFLLGIFFLFKSIRKKIGRFYVDKHTKDVFQIKNRVETTKMEKSERKARVHVVSMNSNRNKETGVETDDLSVYRPTK